VTVHPRPHWLWMLIEAVTIALVSGYAIRDWREMVSLTRAIFLWVATAGTVGWFYQLSGSEVIEFDARQLRIRKDILGWNRVREYKIEDCQELEPHKQKEDDHYGLQCKVGWRTIRFGEYLSELQAVEVITTLQRDLPDVAQRLGSNTEDKRHFVTLGLSSR